MGIYEGDYSRARARKIISLFPELRDKIVLDIGCGSGFYSLAAFRKNCKDAVLIDISSVCVKSASLNFAENTGLNPKVLIADATALPFRENYFDFVLCIDLIEHVKEDIVLLQEIKRVLKRNGLLLIAT